MAGGAIYPSSDDLGSSGDLFPNVYQGGGGNAAPNERGYGVSASLASDRTLGLRFPMPPTIPSGTLKLRALFLANATSGAIKYTVSARTRLCRNSRLRLTLCIAAHSARRYGDADAYGFRM